MTIKPIKSVKISNDDLLKNRPKLQAGLTIVRENGEYGEIVAIRDASKAVSDYMWLKSKAVLGYRISQSVFDVLKKYEGVFTPLEKDGRKGINYEQVRVDTSGGADDIFGEYLQKKQDAIIKAEKIHQFIDSHVDKCAETGAYYRLADFAYSPQLKLLFYGFQAGLTPEDIINKIGERRSFINDRHKSNLARGMTMVENAANALGCLFFGNKKGSIQTSIGEMNFSDNELAHIEQQAINGLKRGFEVERF